MPPTPFSRRLAPALTLLLLATGMAAGQPAPKQGAALLKTDLMFVAAHPDDETGAAATLARYARGRGMTVANVYCTRGEGGGNMVGTQGGAALGLLREAELRDALNIVGVRYVFFLDQLDWAYTESVAATLRKWNRKEALGGLVRILRTLRPDVMLTMNPAPTPGQHGHHQAAGVLATEAFDLAADPHAYPEQLKQEGLGVWQPRKLYYGGGGGSTVATIRTDEPLPDGRTPADVAAAALVNHRSQAFGNFGNAPFMRRPQQFTLARTAVPAAAQEGDLFDGVPGRDPTALPLLIAFRPPAYELPTGRPAVVRWSVTNLDRAEQYIRVAVRAPHGWRVRADGNGVRLAPGKSASGTIEVTPPESAAGQGAAFTGVVAIDEREVTSVVPVQAVAPLTLGFVPRPAIVRYRAWAAQHQVAHVAAQLPADLPLTEGEPGVVEVKVRNAGPDTVTGELCLTAPPGWKVVPPSQPYRSAPGGPDGLLFRVTPPPGASDAELEARTTVNGRGTRATANAHPLPLARVTRLARPPRLDGTDSGWGGLPVQRITPSMVAGGRPASTEDCSATFRLGYDATMLYVDVDVTDDVIVSNIAPDDIRGHWRSDSVEVCIDPQAGAEDTLGSFKVGIFPFDTTGKVRAARDADRNPGPIEESAPGLRLVSRRTPTGYRIQAAIPLHDVGGAPGRRLGFNVIVYDGDKKDAAIGENINKSRIAWSPRPGVQGRPEDWGRILLR
jgi:LmbE family N-acetylglucosaminyl deacetylase